MTFDEWVARTVPMNGAEYTLAKCAWEAATQTEREACAKVCDDQSREMFSADMTWECNGAATCATAIRARSNE